MIQALIGILLNAILTTIASIIPILKSLKLINHKFISSVPFFFSFIIAIYGYLITFISIHLINSVNEENILISNLLSGILNLCTGFLIFLF